MIAASTTSIGFVMKRHRRRPDDTGRSTGRVDIELITFP